MQWFYDNQGKKEEVMLERWQWIAVYKDGTVFQQFTPDGVFHRIGEIDQERLASIVMVNSESFDTGRLHVKIPSGAKLVHLYRNYVLKIKGQEVRARVYVFGYKLGDRYSLLFIMPNNGVIFSDDYNLQLSESIVSQIKL